VLKQVVERTVRFAEDTVVRRVRRRAAKAAAARAFSGDAEASVRSGGDAVVTAQAEHTRLGAALSDLYRLGGVAVKAKRSSDSKDDTENTESSNRPPVGVGERLSQQQRTYHHRQKV
jgi:restriction endonuclease Mrr